MAKYATVLGFIQFEPNEEKIPSGAEVRRVLVQAVGSGGKNVRVTVWPEHADVELAKGDAILAQGKFETRPRPEGGEPYLNLSASDLIVFKNPGKITDDVENPVTDEDDSDEPF